MTTSNMKRLTGKSILAGGLALAAMGFAAGTAQAVSPNPPPPPPPWAHSGSAQINANPQPYTHVHVSPPSYLPLPPGELPH